MLLSLAAALPLWLIAQVPPPRAPWFELELSDPASPARAWKQRRAALDPDRCLAVLRNAGIPVEPVPDRVTGPGCGFTNAVRLGELGGTRFDTVTLACPALLAMAIWERQELQPAARELLGSEVARIEHFGSYACRGIYGRENARRSSHATADAIDVAGFRLADGRRIRIARDHALTAKSPDEATAAFLERVAVGACRSFRVVLGPAYNAAHRDHFHLEWTAVRWRLCR